jgi:hypothetical protein
MEPAGDNFSARCKERETAGKLRQRWFQNGFETPKLMNQIAEGAVSFGCLKSKLRAIGRALARTEGLADLLIKLIPGVDGQDHRREDEFALLAELEDAAILSRKAEFEKLGMELARDRPWLAAHIIEELARVGAWREARTILEQAVGVSLDSLDRTDIPVVGAPRPTMVALPMFVDISY